MKTTLIILLAIALSVAVGYSDLHQTDTSVSVAVLLIAGFVVGLLVTRRAWIYGLLVGAGIPVANLWAAIEHLKLSGMQHGTKVYWYASYKDAAVSCVAILLAVIAVYFGKNIRELFKPKKVI